MNHINLVKIDQICDYIPVVSSVNNLVDLFLKCVVLPCMERGSITNSHYFTHINNKSYARCITLLVPIIGNIAIALCERNEKKTVQPNNQDFTSKTSLQGDSYEKKTVQPINQDFTSKTSLQGDSYEKKTVQPIDQDFTSKTSLEDQRKAHDNAIIYLKKELSNIGAEFECVSHPKTTVPEFGVANIFQDLNPEVFKAQYTAGVQEDIIRDGKRADNYEVVYGAASQFNGCEAPSKFTINPGEAAAVYQGDRTQGPQAQLAFGNDQVEIINCGGNLGFNGLCNLLDETTKGEIAHGYFTPSEANEAKVIDQLKNNGNRIAYPVIASIPRGGNKRVHLFLVAAPAFGYYQTSDTVTGDAKNEVQFLCALHGFRAQFQKCIDLAKKTKSPVRFNPTGVGLGVFGNEPNIVARGFYMAAKEYEQELIDNKVEVRFQIFNRGQPDAKASNVATALGLKIVS